MNPSIDSKAKRTERRLDGKTEERVVYKLVNDTSRLNEKNTVIKAKAGDAMAVKYIFDKLASLNKDPKEVGTYYIVKEVTTVTLTVVDSPE